MVTDTLSAKSLDGSAALSDSLIPEYEDFGV